MLLLLPSLLFSCWLMIYLGFLSQPFTNHRTAGEGEGISFNSSLPLPTASQTLRHQPGYYCRELTSAHKQQPNSNQEPLVSRSKALTTKLRALYIVFHCCWCIFQHLICRDCMTSYLVRDLRLFRNKVFSAEFYLAIIRFSILVKKHFPKRKSNSSKN